MEQPGSGQPLGDLYFARWDNPGDNSPAADNNARRAAYLIRSFK
jgi:hypothetical protein